MLSKISPALVQELNFYKIRSGFVQAKEQLRRLLWIHTSSFSQQGAKVYKKHIHFVHGGRPAAKESTLSSALSFLHMLTDNRVRQGRSNIEEF